MPDMDKLLDDLKQKRDELRLQIHLGSKEAQDEWEELESKWEKFAADAKLDKSASEIGDAASKLGSELMSAYDRIKKAIT